VRFELLVDSPMKKRETKKLTPERLQQFGFAYAPPLIISAAVNNKVFDTLEGGAKTVEQLKNKTGASARGLRAIMDALVGLELLKKDRQSRYSLTPESEAFLISEKPGTLAGFFGSILPVMTSRWLRLTDIVRDGRPVVAVNQETEGTEFFSQLVETIIPMSYPGAQKLADHLKVAKAKRDRFDFIEGDLLQANFGSGYDVATLGHILHSEGEQRSRQLLKKTFRALKSGGTIAIAEWLVNDDRTKPLPSLMFSVQMLVNTEKGDTFSFNEIKKWLEDAGFKKVRKLEAPGPSPLILATKP